MPKLICIVEGKGLSNAAEDFRAARRVEQYRVSDAALYIPEGFRWNYIPFDSIDHVDESFRVISAGHCVPVREKRPELDLSVGGKVIHLQLEKQSSMQAVLDVLNRARV